MPRRNDSCEADSEATCAGRLPTGYASTFLSIYEKLVCKAPVVLLSPRESLPDAKGCGGVGIEDHVACGSEELFDLHSIHIGGFLIPFAAGAVRTGVVLGALAKIAPGLPVLRRIEGVAVQSIEGEVHANRGGGAAGKHTCIGINHHVFIKPVAGVLHRLQRGGLAVAFVDGSLLPSLVELFGDTICVRSFWPVVCDCLL